ncbi:MAG: energy transducer TonB [Desulfovibrionales bacterium]|nr:energy transducer TonB [Desulfovibrionales bacterium]
MAYDVDIFSLDHDFSENNSAPACLAPALCVEENAPGIKASGSGLSMALILTVLLHGAVATAMSLSIASVPMLPAVVELALFSSPPAGPAPGSLPVGSQSAPEIPAAPTPVLSDPPAPPVVTQPEPTPVAEKKPVHIPKKSAKRTIPKKQQPGPVPPAPTQNAPARPGSIQAAHAPVAGHSSAPTNTGPGSGTGHGQGSGTSTSEHASDQNLLGSGPVQAGFGEADGPRFVRRVTPVFPRLARQRGREGVVILRLRISAQGDLINAEIVQKAGYGFDEEALRAAHASTYAPARYKGRQVECSALLPIRFSLRNG